MEESMTNLEIVKRKLKEKLCKYLALVLILLAILSIFLDNVHPDEQASASFTEVVAEKDLFDYIEAAENVTFNDDGSVEADIKIFRGDCFDESS